MASSKRDFGRAFDEPVGFSGDAFAQEPQAVYASPARYVPGQWPEEQPYTVEEVAPAPRSSFFATVARFATSVTLDVYELSHRLVQRFMREQQIRAVPIVREDGASKRRLVDAGLAPVTPTRRRDSGARRGSPQQHSRSPDVTRNRSPSLWIETPPTPPTHNPIQHPEGFQDDDIDDSLDWSMEDVDSGTPPRNPYTDSPTGTSWLRRPARVIITPKRVTPKKVMPEPRIISPNSQFAILRHSSVTPMRKQLLKKQLRAVEAVTTTSPIQQQPDHTVASPTPQDFSISDLKKTSLASSVLSINAATVAATAQEANARYKAELKSRENRDAEARAAAERDYYNPVDTIDIDLSYLPDASNLSSVANLNTPTPSPPYRKALRWASQSHVKSYYVDERISEMLDSTLESIRSPIPKPNFEDDDDDEATEDIHPLTFEDPEPTSDSDDSVDGLSLDDSLEESQISKELLEDLEEDFKNLLAQAPPPRPPPVPLIAPLSDEERARLDDIVLKSKHGRNEAFPIVPHKVTARDFGTLLPDQFNGSSKAWLNDEIVDEYLAILVKELKEEFGFTFKRGGPAPPFHAFSSHWLNSMKGGLKNVERWAGRVGLGGKQYLDAKVILYPICDASHWRLLAVKPKERVIEYLDSLGWDGSKYVDKLRIYLQHELKEHYKAEEWTVVEGQRSSRQLNGSDCGVFTLLNALVMLRGDDIKKVVACNGMQEARERMAITIINGRPTGELDY